MSDVTVAPDAAADIAARQAAVDPGRNIVLEASAGTGKTRVLVERYVNLLRAGIEPDHILAITFTRKAAAEMRARIIERLREASRQSELDLRRWRELKDHLADIAISTIDAFCLSLIREFPLEADIDPGFELADDTEVPRLVAESLDQALRICRRLAKDDDDVALVFAQLGESRLRSGLALLLDRRLVAPQALRKYLAGGPRDLTAAVACERAAADLSAAFHEVPDGIEAFLASGPIQHPQFAMLADDIRQLAGADRHADVAVDAGDGRTPAAREEMASFRVLLDRLRAYFLTQDGRPRERNFLGTGFNADDCASTDAWKRHRVKAAGLSPRIAEIVRRFRRDLNVVQSRGVWRMYAVALQQYERTLEARALLDFSGVLDKAVRLLKDMDEFAESRFRLESRYRHVLVDEFQDTSRAQWDLVAQLVRTWGEGLGAAADALPPSIFIVADRKQSIYAFRDAEVAVLDEAAAFIDLLRPDGKASGARHAISVSFRAAPELLAFVNDVFTLVEKSPARSDAFRYDDRDRFPLTLSAETTDPAIGLVVGSTVPEAAGKLADEVARVLREVTVRDRTTGVRRSAQPADIAILFRSRDSHRDFEKAIEARGILTYVYKGLGFFEADEVQDATAVLRYLADPTSNLRAAAFLRSRVVRLSDSGVAALAPNIVSALLDGPTPAQTTALSDEDRRVFTRVRASIPEWLAHVDRVSPSELLTAVLDETAYAVELGGPAWRQARENLKKLRGMIRRFENRGYATLARVAAHLDELAVGDESNAAIDARDAVSLMTVHASKGLEFPVVFVVNMGRGTGGIRPAIRVAMNAAGESFVSVADYQSESDEDAQLREREETKRLLYVALTRARDRLYLSATVEGGVFRAGRGSLAEVLPPSVRRLFELAGMASEDLTWSPAGDDPDSRPEDAAVHRLLVAPPKPAPPPAVSSEPPTNLSFDW